VKKMMNYRILLTASLFTLASCSNSGDSPESSKPTSITTDLILKKMNELADNDNCAAKPIELCNNKKTVSFNDGRHMLNNANSDHIAVMEPRIDEMWLFVARKRFTSAWELQNGTLIPWNPSLSASTNYFEIADLIDSDLKDSRGAYSSFFRKFTASYGFLDSDDEGHNQPLLGAILDSNPKSPISVIKNYNLDGLLKKEYVCGDETKDLQDSRSIRDRLDIQLSSGELGKVRFINLSAGFGPAGVKSEYLRVCGKPLLNSAKLEFLEKSIEIVMQAFGDSRNRILVQSAAGPGDVGLTDLTSSSQSSRVLTGGFNSLTSNLDERGIDANRKTYWTDKTVGEHADVYVNFRTERDEKKWGQSYSYMTNGLYEWPVGTPIAIVTTSASAPLVLSRLVNIRETVFSGRTWDSGIVKDLKDLLTPRECDYITSHSKKCIFQDPIGNKQTESFRLGYRK
jgi:hypothetical protein